MDNSEHLTTGEILVFEHSFRATPETIWKALTDKESMKKWYFDIAAFKAEPGFDFEFSGGKDGRSYRHLCKVIEAQPNKKLCHSWRYDGYEGISYVTWDLSPEGTGTRLRLSHEGLKSFPAVPDFAIANFREGWKHILHTGLVKYLGED